MKMWKGLLAVSALLATTVPAEAGYAPATILFRFKSTAIEEASGFAESWQTPSVYWTHNDSPAAAINTPGRFFGVDGTGATVADIQLRGTVNVDWEDMAVGPGSGGETAVFLADIGDNARARPFLLVHEVAEPSVGGPVARDLLPDAVHVLVYEDGPHDAETFLVDPRDGSFAVVTKEATGISGVYVADVLAAGSPRVLRRVASIDFRGIASDTFATGGAIARDGSRVAVRTYDEAFEWPLGNRTLAEAFAQPPLRIELPYERQGEAVAYAADSVALLTCSEGIWAPVHRLLPE